MEWIQGISPIEFPLFGININPPVGFSIGGVKIHFYGILIGIGLMLAVFYGWKRCKQFGIKQENITDGILYIVPFAILCARLYFCILKWKQYAPNPISVLYIWEGGLAIPGGIIGAVIGIFVFCRFRKIKAGAMLDLVFLGFLIGQSIGRWGNFINREAYGEETNIFLRMGLFLDADRVGTLQMHYYHPTFLYESLWNALGFVLLHRLSKKRKYDGQIALCYVAWYGLGRAAIEGLRTDALGWDTVRFTQLLALVAGIAAVVVLAVLWRKPHAPEQLYVNQKKEEPTEGDKE